VPQTSFIEYIENPEEHVKKTLIDDMKRYVHIDTQRNDRIHKPWRYEVTF
jgi:hypothetical protein